MFKPIKTVFLLILFLFVSVSQVSSHGSGSSFPKDVGDYRLEFEYDVPEIISGEVNAFIFRILDKKTQDAVVFDSALVRFERKEDNSTFLVTRLAQDELQEGVVRLTAVLPKGEYLINLSFKKGDIKLAETTYDLSVKEGEKSVPLIVVILLSVLGGSLVTFLTFRYFSNKNAEKH